MAATYDATIQLSTDDGLKTDPIDKDTTNIGGSNTKYKVTIVSGEGAVWLLYSDPYYGRGGVGVGQSIIAYPTGKTEKAGFTIKSVQAFNVTHPGMCLFEHENYKGNKLHLQASVPDITESFPAGEVPGLSSVIATSGQWKLYLEKDFNGDYKEVNAINQRVELWSLGSVNDKVKSVKLVRAS